MLRWLRLIPMLAAFTGLACGEAPDTGAREVPISKSSDSVQEKPEVGPTQNIPMH